MAMQAICAGGLAGVFRSQMLPHRYECRCPMPSDSLNSTAEARGLFPPGKYNGVRHSDLKYELVLPWPCRSHRRRGWKFRAGQGSDGSVRALRGTRRDEKTEIFPSSHKFRYSLRRALRIEV